MLRGLVYKLLFGGAAMSHLSPDFVRGRLLSSIDSLLDLRSEFLVNPETDFTRTKKISFEQTMLFPMIAGADNLDTELIDFFNEDMIPSASSMIQRRSQIKSAAFKHLFFTFTSLIPVLRTFQGYRLIACDGSRLNLPYNPSDPDTFIQCISSRRGINQIHLNSLYDILNDLFLDVELQPVKQMDEKNAFCRFLQKQLSPQLSIFIADRGYAAYNVFGHGIHNAQLFLIRVPEAFAKGICTGKDHWLEGDAADIEVTVTVGRSRAKKNRQLENYHCIDSKGHYDFIEPGSADVDVLKLRVLKFPVGENNYEYIVTNIPQYRLSRKEIKEIYRLRWGIETAFRHLKYAGNMVHLHSVKREFLLQEIYAKLTMYNFSAFLAKCADKPEKRSSCKYSYEISHTRLQKISNRFLTGKIKDVLALLVKALVPVRPGRSFQRNLRRQSADTLAYR